MDSKKTISKDSRMPVDTKLMYIRLFVTFMLGLALNYVPGILKIVVIPYLYYLLVARSIENVPSLVLLFGLGTILNFAAIFVIIPLVWREITKGPSQFMKRSYYALLLLLPIYICITAYRVLLGVNFVDAMTLNSYYTAYFIMLYGFTLPGLLSKKSLFELTQAGLIIVLLGYILRDFSTFSLLIRNGNYFTFISIAIIIAGFRLEGKILSYTMLTLLILVLGFLGVEVKFTAFIQISLSLYMVLRMKMNLFRGARRKLNKFERRVIVLFPVIFLTITLSLFSSMLGGIAKEVDNVSYLSLENAKFKIFGDRAVLWDGVIDGIAQNSELLPPVEGWNISFRNIQGSMMDVEFESHNLALDIIRKNGFVAGFVLIVIYLSGMFYAMGSLHHVNPYGIVLGSLVIGAGVSVFLTGQYTLQLNSSFFFMLIIGSIIKSKYVKSGELLSV